MTAVKDDAWHLDKKVPIAIIIALAVQTGTITWWAATMDSRMKAVERSLPELQPRSLCLEQHTLLDSRIHHVESQGVNRFEMMSKRLDRIETKQDRIIELLNGG